MQNPALFHVLLDHLEAIGASAHDVDRLVDRWHRLKSHEAFPCPVCYLAGKEQPLAVLPAQVKFEPVKCPSCRTQFDVPIDAWRKGNPGMSDYLTAQELADLVGCKPNRGAAMKAWLEKSAWSFVMDRNGMPKVLRLYRDRKLGISDDSQSTIDSKAASGPDRDAFKGKGPRSAVPQSGSTSSY